MQQSTQVLANEMKPILEILLIIFMLDIKGGPKKRTVFEITQLCND